MTRHMLLLLVAATVLCCAVAAGLSGCARSDRKKVAGIVFQEDQFFRLVTFGMREAAAKNGVDLLEANSANKPDKEIQLVNTYIASGVNAIVISPLSVKASVSALERARQKGITVVTYNTNVEGDIPAASIESDQYSLGATTGKAAREYIESRLGGKASVAILAFQSMNPEQNMQRVQGFKDQLAPMPGVTIVAEQDAWLAEQAVKKGGDILTAHPGLNILWSANEGGTVGCVMAVKNAARAGKVVVFGTDASEQLANFLLAEDNILQAVTGQRPYEIGFMAVEVAVKALNGQRVEKKTALPGLLLSRTDIAGITAFKERLAQLNR